MAIPPQAIVSIAEIYLPPIGLGGSEREKTAVFRDLHHIW
jgi:hypothetical protein